MAEFTKEQLIEKLERRLAVTTHYPDFEEAQLDAQIFKIALEALTAGMEQEPVAWLLSGGGAKNNVSFDSGNAYADPLREVTPLYTAPPAPVSVPAAMEIDDDFDSAFEHGKAVGWNAYRAAMLQSQDSGIKDSWISCSERMPNDAQWCVVNTKYGYYVQCWSEGQWWLGDDISIPECDVINWMPLPEPPQEVNRG